MCHTGDGTPPTDSGAVKGDMIEIQIEEIKYQGLVEDVE
jgi:hypothetical protein